MFPHNFLSQMAHERELSPEQEQVFLMRMGDNEKYERIAEHLLTSPDACLKRMGQIYKKFNIVGNSRGKENRLRIFLIKELEKWQQLEEQTEQFSVNTQPANIPHPEAEHNVTPAKHKPSVLQNLPARECRAFVGRSQEIARLMELLDSQHSAHLISVDGIGGVGKTTLVVEVAYRCLEASQHSNLQIVSTPTFEAIIFTSAKQNYLTANGLLPRLTFQRTLRDICREIAYTLDFLQITNLPYQEQIELIRQKLSQIKTLLIVDNLETIENKQEVLSFLYDLPPTVKVIVTTREQALFVPIRLDCLPKEHGLRLIQHEAKEKNLNLSAEQSQLLFEGVSGVPAAIIYAIGQMAAGYLLQDVLLQIKQPDGDVAGFCFAGSVTPLRGTPTHYLLMTLALFVQPVTRDTVAQVAFDRVNPIAISQGLAKLQQLSLVYQQQERYGLLELTREYVLAELAVHNEFAQKLRERWVNWYLRFSEAYGGTNWKEWHLGHGYLEVEWENLRTVLEWCISRAMYSDVRAMWRHIKGYIHIRGYWDERLDWTAWLIETAKQVGDWSFAVEVMSDRAITLLNMRQARELQQAEALLKEAWNLRHHQTITFQLELARNMVILHIHQQQLAIAQEWLTKEQKLLEQASLSDLECREQQVHILYYQGQIYFKNNNYQQAQAIFQKALEQAQALGWQRATAAIQNWLADISLKLGNIDQAREILTLSFPMAERHKDRRSIAFHKATFARLEKLSGNLAQAQRWAKEAAEVFDSLMMVPEAQEMRSFAS